MRNKLIIPNHIAIIMDGNGRWAKQRMIPKKLGHRQGMVAAEKIVEECKKIGVSYLTLYAFSLENWLRREEEVNDLMHLLRDYLNNRISELVESGIRLIFIGNRKLLPTDIQQKMLEVEDISKQNNFTLIMAISYGARDEIRRAAYNMADYILRNKISKVPDDMFERFINPFNIPTPDLLIRTSGEQRLSNFLLWQLAYSELYFIEKLWPDFDKNDLIKAIEDFTSRERRYGK
ncbi:MAG: polyprenyl diphosphate synthase [Candidatus Midichloria sp.]|nr:MAG: polyprenyl diphosphate synthase [Candidatus Midichloria sp.]